MATFGGASIFGAAVHMKTQDAQRAVQHNAFFGLSGLESLDGGLRGRVTSVSGLIYGNSPSNCASNVETFRSYNDGLYYNLVDTSGTTWANVRLLDFDPEENGFPHTQLGYVRRYRAAFFHLT